MSSFYGNGGYSSGGGGGSGEVISVNGKKGQVTLDAADVHALPEDTQIPSLEGFATEAWVNESINSLPKNDSTWLGGAFLGKNQFNDIKKVIIPFGSFKGEFPGVIQYEGDINDFSFKLRHVQQTEFNLNNLGVILTIDNINYPDYLNFYLDDQSGDIVIPIANLAPPNNNLRIRIVIDENDNVSFESILESKVMNYFNKVGQSISKITFVILDSFNNNQSNINTFPIEITPHATDISGSEVIAPVYRANHTVDEVVAAIDNGLMTYAYIKDDAQNKNYYLTSSSIEGPVFAYIDSQANNISTIHFMNQYGGDNRVTIKTNIPIIHSHQDISGKADKTELPNIITTPNPVQWPSEVGSVVDATALKTGITSIFDAIDIVDNKIPLTGEEIEGQVLTIDFSGQPKWDNKIPTVTNDFTDDYKNKVDSLWEDYQDALTALG